MSSIGHLTSLAFKSGRYRSIDSQMLPTLNNGTAAWIDDQSWDSLEDGANDQYQGAPLTI